jgi:hypothetical protein
MVAGFNASLKVAVNAWLVGIPVAALVGVVEITVGGVGAGAVLKLQTYALPRAPPVEPMAPVEIVAVNRVLTASRAAGVKVATLPVHPTVPVMGVPPGPVNVNVVAGETRLVQLIASLKVALSAWLVSTPVAPFAGTVEVMVGGTTGAAVVKLQT